VAAVVCRQLGYNIGRLLELSIVNDGSNQIWIDNITCNASETHVEQCSHNDSGNWQWGSHNCGHNQDIGVGCDASNGSSQSGAYPGIHLINNGGTTVASYGTFALQGRVEVRKNGIWGTVCNSNTDESNYSGGQAVDDRVAEVVCRQMGWTVGRLVELSIVPDSSNQIWMDNLNCPNWPITSSTLVEQCNHNDSGNWQWGMHGCMNSQDIGIGCDTKTSSSIAGA
jgi:hypothetical protein